MKRIIISGGGTGGHIYPALAIADECKLQFPQVEILFVGALGRMEMEKVPKAGYEIVGLPIAGFNRKNLLKNTSLPWKLFRSLWLARKTIKRFNPDLVIGVGGYASGPTLKMANLLGVPTLIQEQNSFPGKTNLLLAKNAKAICVAYPNMDDFFSKEKIHLTGNPVRSDILEIHEKRAEALSYFKLDEFRKTVFIMGGSLGANSMNKGVVENIEEISKDSSIQILWQCGARNYEALKAVSFPDNIKLLGFVDRMDLAYAAADIIVSRAGATSISELAIVGKPAVLVPSPNVAEDHQTKNAESLSSHSAAILLPDSLVSERLLPVVKDLLNDAQKRSQLSNEILRFAKANATRDIVEIAHKCLQP